MDKKFELTNETIVFRTRTLYRIKALKDFETVKKDTERDHWLTAQEAADYGIVGTIISSRKELPEA